MDDHQTDRRRTPVAGGRHANMADASTPTVADVDSKTGGLLNEVIANFG